MASMSVSSLSFARSANVQGGLRISVRRVAFHHILPERE